MERSSVMAHPSKVEPEASLSEMIKQVLQLVQKDGALSKKQAVFCDDACVMRYLKARGNNVRKAAKMLRATLDWREKIDIGYLIADEFPAELAAGAAYVAGHDVEGRPILVIKKKPEYILNRTHREYIRYIIFTMEVAVAAMPPGVDQWVLILDAGGYSTLSAPSTSGIITTLKMLADHYPERLARAFIVDASSVFYYVWKGICAFVDHSTRRKLIFAYSRDYHAIPKPQNTSRINSILTSPFSKYPRKRSSSFCADTVAPVSFLSKTVSADYSLLEPIFDTSPKNTGDTKSLGRLIEGPELASSIRRSFSFSSVTGSITCLSPDRRDGDLGSSFRRGEEDDISQPERSRTFPAQIRRYKAPSWDSFVSLFKSTKQDPTIDEVKNRNIEAFRPYCTFLQARYDEAAYRKLMKPPLGGLAMIISRDLKRMVSI